MLNNEALIQYLVTPAAFPEHTPRHLIPADPVLSRPLPLLRFLEAAAVKRSHQTRRDHILAESLATATETPLDAFAVAPTPKEPAKEQWTSATLARKGGSARGGGRSRFEAFEVLKAIEKQDVMFLMEVRHQAHYQRSRD